MTIGDKIIEAVPISTNHKPSMNAVVPIEIFTAKQDGHTTYQKHPITWISRLYRNMTLVFSTIIEKYTDSTFPPLSSIDNNDLRKWRIYFPIMILFQGSFLSLFIWLCYTGYVSNITSKYLSPIDTDHSYQYCDPVSVTVTGTFLMDSNGLWEGSQNFSYEKALYKLKLVNIALTTSEYEEIITKFATEVKAIGENMIDRDISYSLIAWTTFASEYSVGSGTIRLSAIGDASKLFNNQYYGAAVTRKNAYCLSPALAESNPWSVSYDYYTSEINVNIPVSLSYTSLGEALAEEPCPSLFTVADDFLFDSKFDSSLSIKFDARSIAVAISINIRISSFDTLAAVSETVLSNNQFYGLYFSEEYPDMVPIFCYSIESTNIDQSSYHDFTSTMPKYKPYQNSTYPVTCLVRSGNQYFYPLFVHEGIDSTCWYGNEQCKSSSGGNCIVNNQLIGLMFVSESNGGLFTLIDKTNQLQTVIDSSATGDISVSNKMFQALAASAGILRWVNAFGTSKSIGNTILPATPSQTSTCYPSFNQTIIAEFSNANLYQTETFITIGMKQRASDFLTAGKVIMNKYAHLLENGGFNDTLYKENVFSNMLSPPMPLTQDYEICSLGSWLSFYSSVGMIGCHDSSIFECSNFICDFRRGLFQCSYDGIHRIVAICNHIENIHQPHPIEGSTC